jgi:secondary thiamine-phosphate synthase enzyme
METTMFDVHTGSRFTVADLTSEIEGWLRGMGDGLCNVFVPHATAGLALLETGAGTEVDAQTVLEQVFPRDDRWVHRHGSPGHGADHVLPLLVNSTLTLPVQDGRLLLGTWQSVVLVDTNVDNPTRTVRVSFLPG